MSVRKWYLPTLSEIIALSEQNSLGQPLELDELSREHPTFDPTHDRPRTIARKRLKAEKEWYAAIAALNTLLQAVIKAQAIDSSVQGLVLSGSSPILENTALLSHLSTWTFTTEALSPVSRVSSQLLPAAKKTADACVSTAATLPLFPDDPLTGEQFCLVLTAQFCLAMSLGEDADGYPVFLFSFSPAVAQQAWRSLQSRLLLNSSPLLLHLEKLVQEFAPIEPNYRTVTQFHRLMLDHLPDSLDTRSRRRTRVGRSQPFSLNFQTAKSNLNSASNKVQSAAWKREATVSKPNASRGAFQSGDRLDRSPSSCEKTGVDVELLQAIAHEVRTPLTTIRTLTRLLLKRKELPPDVIKRLQVIDRECTEQIDRFNLIFRAVELETAAKRPSTPLAAISLDQLFDQNIPRWQQQAGQHSLTLDVLLPQKLPLVVSDPTMLDQVLTGLIDRITHTLPAGSHIQVQVTLAGHQLKLQFQSQPQPGDKSETAIYDLSSYFAPTLKSIGDLLMFQPETGNLSLNLAVTKNLFQALGGKLTVRHRRQQGEILTIFLPLENA